MNKAEQLKIIFLLWRSCDVQFIFFLNGPPSSITTKNWEIYVTLKQLFNFTILWLKTDSLVMMPPRITDLQRNIYVSRGVKTGKYVKTTF